MNKKSKAGGYREGSGRPRGTGKFGERTQPVRVPISLLPEIKKLLSERKKQEELAAFGNVHPFQTAITSPPVPLYSNRVAAGFPSLVDDAIESHLDLNQYLIQRPSTSFFVRVEGDSMIDAGIHENDILIVDRSLKPLDGKIIIAVVNNELTVKRLELKQQTVRLLPENPRYRPIDITEEMDFRIWGVVIHVIHPL